MPPSQDRPQTLLVVGVGPGIGTSVTRLFASKNFNQVGLIRRDKRKLEDDVKSLKKWLSDKFPEKKVTIRGWNADVGEPQELEPVLKAVESTFGGADCVIFNPALVAPISIGECSEDRLVSDFKTTTVGLYTTAFWALPLMSDNKEGSKPSFFVTSSFLWKEPYPPYFSLSLVKASQRNLVQSFALTYPDVHIALVNVGGIVTNEHKFLNPVNIANKFWELYLQPRKDWGFDIDVLGE